MARSHKPIIWSLFAAGGTFAAFFTPVMIVITGLAISVGLLPADTLAYDRVLTLVHNPVAKIGIFIAIFLPTWHAAHRLRITAHDFGVRADIPVATLCYTAAAVLTAVTVWVLVGV